MHFILAEYIDSFLNEILEKIFVSTFVKANLPYVCNVLREIGIAHGLIFTHALDALQLENMIQAKAFVDCWPPKN